MAKATLANMIPNTMNSVFRLTSGKDNILGAQMKAKGKKNNTNDIFMDSQQVPKKVPRDVLQAVMHPTATGGDTAENMAKKNPKK